MQTGETERAKNIFQLLGVGIYSFCFTILSSYSCWYCSTFLFVPFNILLANTLQCETFNLFSQLSLNPYCAVAICLSFISLALYFYGLLSDFQER